MGIRGDRELLSSEFEKAGIYDMASSASGISPIFNHSVGPLHITHGPDASGGMSALMILPPFSKPHFSSRQRRVKTLPGAKLT
jgi:hypothetical protein